MLQRLIRNNRFSLPLNVNPQSLSVHLLLWILPATILALCIASSGAFYAARNQILHDIQKEVDDKGENIAEQIGAFVLQRHNDLVTIAQSPLFKDYYKNTDYHLTEESEVYRHEIELMLLRFSKRTGVYARLRYLDASGRVICRIDDDKIITHPKDPASREILDTLRIRPSHVFESPLIPASWRGHPTIRIGTALFDENMKFRGGLLFDYSMAPVFQLLDRSRVGSAGRNYLIRRDKGAQLSQTTPAERKLTAWADVPLTPWTVQIIADPREFLAGIIWIRNATALLLIGLSIAIILIVSSRVRSATNPIQQLARAADIYAQGNLEARVPITKPREVAVLAVAFNAMADRLQQRTEDLEKRVKELSALQRMNDAVMHRLGRREIARVFLEAVITGLGFEGAALYWVNESKGEIVGECVFGAKPLPISNETIRGRQIRCDSNDILAEVVKTRNGIIIPDASKDPRFDQRYVDQTHLKSVCFSPIPGRDNQVIGIIGANYHFSGKSVGAEDAKQLSLFCSVAGLALENAQLFDATIRSESRYRTAVENSPDATVSLDQNYRVTLWNRRAEGLFGHQPTEAFGRTLEFIIDTKDYQALIRQVEVDGAVRHREAAGITRDGRKLDLMISWTGQQSEHGGAREWFVVIQDMTERKRLESQLLQAEKMSAVGGLVAGVCHELNNPLANVTAYSEFLMERSELSAKGKDDLRVLYSSALRCRDIVSGLLSFARMQQSEKHRISLNRVVQDTLSLVEYHLRKRDSIHVDVDLAPASPAAAGDFQKFQQILVNLIVNACDAVKERRSRGIIRIATSSTPKFVAIEVEDNGPGIPAEIRQRIFDPFFTTKSPGEGTGLGLSICSQIASEFGGTLRCEPSSFGGARFIAAFPHCPEGLEEHVRVTQLPPAVANRRALVVDDEPDVAQMMFRILKDDGLDVQLATRFDQAVNLISQRAYHLVVADVALGGAVRGTDIAAIAARLERRPFFLFVSGDVLNQALHEEISALKAPFLAKPFLRTEFLRMTRTILSKTESAAG